MLSLNSGLGENLCNHFLARVSFRSWAVGLMDAGFQGDAAGV